MKIWWSREARTRLREIHAFIAKDSPAAADKVIATLIHRSMSLVTPPLTGRRLPEYPDTDLRELLERPYRLIYIATPKGVEIVTVMHYRQLLPSEPKRS